MLGGLQTGDEAALSDGYYRILGRRSVDILKTGGYKVSALEIEDVFREHTDVVDLAVVGLDSEQWGQTVAAAVVPSGPGLTATELADWAKDRLAPYKIPRHFHMVSELPRNAMGKVQKPEVAKLIRDSD